MPVLLSQGERGTEDPLVIGSNPVAGTNNFLCVAQWLVHGAVDPGRGVRFSSQRL